MLFFTIGFLGGVICAVIATSKRRSLVGWFVIGFLLPLVGVILVLVLPPGEVNLEANMMDLDHPPPPRPVDSRQASLEALERLAALRDRGVLTAEELDAKKKELLAASASPPVAPAPSTITCPRCQHEVAKTMTIVTGDGVVCDRCYASA
ncbi:MAG: SHOCT domain-containing protein [Kofleriaceae bacterium]